MANLSPAILILILIVGAIVALVVGYFLGSRFGGKKSVAVREATEKHDSYKNDVREHFERTSAIMSRMVDDYRDMYKHMAEGADKLAEMHPEKRVTPPPAPETITRDTTVDGAHKTAPSAKPASQHKPDSKPAEAGDASGAWAADAGGKDSSKAKGAQPRTADTPRDKPAGAPTPQKTTAAADASAPGKPASTDNGSSAGKPAATADAAERGEATSGDKTGASNKQAPSARDSGKRYGLE